MTSTTALTHAATTATPPFNGLFYAAATTIITVLFLAIAVQGPIYQDLVQFLARRAQQQAAARASRTRSGGLPSDNPMPAGPGQLLALMVVTTTIGGILAAGGLAEFLALVLQP
jgi:hypothetical protein